MNLQIDPFAYARQTRICRALSIQEVQRAGGYKAIYADCPWRYDDQNCNGAAEQQYSSMTLDQLCSLPIAQIAAPDCALFAWATFAKIEDALTVIRYWNFQYKSVAFDWVKLRGGRPQMGLGRWTRVSTEVCLLAVRGKPQRQDKSVRQLIESFVSGDEERVLYASATRHSAKPPEVRDRIVQLLGDVPRIELFARDRVPGWDAWGDQVPGGSDVLIA